MIAVVVCAIIAAVGWMFVFGVAATFAGPKGVLPQAPSDAKRLLRLLGFACLAVAAAGQGIAAYQGRGRVAHSAPVVAVSFAGRARLLTLDAEGTLVDWDLHLKREDRRRTVPALAGASELFTGDSADRGFAIAGGQAVLFRPFLDAPVVTIPDARHVAGAMNVVVARERALLSLSYSDWTKAPYEVAWPEPITAIAAGDDGWVAVADRVSISLVDGRAWSLPIRATVSAPGAISTLEVLRDGNTLALDARGSAWAIDFRRGVAQSLPATASLVAGRQRVFLVSGRVVSEYDPRSKAATRVGKIASGARAMDTWDDRVAFGFEGGDVVLGTRAGATLETTRLTAKPAVKP
jgi:hypothetical protein